MIALLQRVLEASVTVDGEVIAQIGSGLLAFVCAVPDDDADAVAAMAQKITALRMFGDDRGRMGRSVTDVRGGLLLVPQFTLAADLRTGNRPSFSRAAPPDQARALFDGLVVATRERLDRGAVAYPVHAEPGRAQAVRAHSAGEGIGSRVHAGRFGADMKVALINDGPVTFWLDVPVRERGGPVVQ